MAQPTTIDHVGAWAWRITPSAGTSPFRYYVDGRLHRGQAISDTSIVVENGNPYEPPIVEVLDSADTDTPQQVQYPPYAVLQWRRADDAAQYRVERLVDGEYETVKRIVDDASEYYVYETPVLSDGDSETWRVVSMDAHGNDGASVTFAFDVVCDPGAPNAIYRYDDDTGELTAIARTQ